VGRHVIRSRTHGNARVLDSALQVMMLRLLAVITSRIHAYLDMMKGMSIHTEIGWIYAIVNTRNSDSQ
jgi:hypothetical protein